MSTWGAVRMADRSLERPLVLLTSVLVLGGLSLGYNGPDIRTPGFPEGGRRIRKWCPFCGRRLSRQGGAGNSLVCRVDGAIREDQALNSRPQRK
jgi:hypothetical protein